MALLPQPPPGTPAPAAHPAALCTPSEAREAGRGRAPRRERGPWGDLHSARPQRPERLAGAGPPGEPGRERGPWGDLHSARPQRPERLAGAGPPGEPGRERGPWGDLHSARPQRPERLAGAGPPGESGRERGPWGDLHSARPQRPERLAGAGPPEINDAPNSSDDDLCHKAGTRQRAFLVVAPALWNALPADVKERNNYLTFRKHLKKYLPPWRHPPSWAEKVPSAYRAQA
ncbi:collagen alpha-1(I) chain-like isoform X2 [Podarcis raffonei]|uniref:collagen alpha-1(I) chain-like isoform X2 n=1 Tax=Podarcis raffonei TaxID=65483 RepID=UPI002329341B|nr:collagen alpha-1(I) chain-like isoform X2 [Podarcis raffonei]